jgi:Fe-coproporphyrin III synthase
MNPAIQSLPVLILCPHSRCNCRCLMCDIWKDTSKAELSLSELERHIEDIERLSVQWVVLSGGEPLMHSDLFRFCHLLRSHQIRVTMLSTGLLLERYAQLVVDHVDDVIVSLDGPSSIHDRIRRVPGAYAMLERGIHAVHQRKQCFHIAGRCTIQHLNYSYVCETARTAKQLGLKSISFLAADVSSEAFNRFPIWNSERQASVALNESEIFVLEREMEKLHHEWLDRGFVLENWEKLQRIVRHYRAHLGLCEPIAPRCNAPWVSAVVEANGLVRPCFFHRPIGSLKKQDFFGVLNGPAAIMFRNRLDVASNPTCRRCVCSLNWKPT